MNIHLRIFNRRYQLYHTLNMRNTLFGFMENTKVISLIGKEEYGDFPYFLSKVLEEKKYRTLVIDNSCSHDIFLSLRRIDKDVDYVEHGRVVYMRNKTVNEDDLGVFEKFDVVIIYQGLNYDEDLLALSDFCVLQTNYLPTTLRYIKDYIDLDKINEFPKENFYVIFRDRPDTKISEQFILNYLELKNIENEFIISFDEVNYSTYVGFCYGGIQNYKNLSSEMKDALISIKTALVGKDNATVAERKRQKAEKEKQKQNNIRIKGELAKQRAEEKQRLEELKKAEKKKRKKKEKEDIQDILFEVENAGMDIEIMEEAEYMEDIEIDEG